MADKKRWYVVTIKYPRMVTNKKGKEKRQIETELYGIRAISYGDAEYTAETIFKDRIKTGLDVFNIGKLPVNDLYIQQTTTANEGDSTKTYIYSATVIMTGVGNKPMSDVHILNATTPKMAIERITRKMAKSVFSHANWKIKNLKETELKGLYDADSPELIADFEQRQDFLENEGYYAAEPAQTTLFNKDGSVKMPNAEPKPDEQPDVLDKYDKINQEGKQEREQEASNSDPFDGLPAEVSKDNTDHVANSWENPEDTEINEDDLNSNEHTAATY